MDQKLENLCSLQETILLNFRNMTPEEVTLIGEVGDLISEFFNIFKLHNFI